jgi:transposase
MYAPIVSSGNVLLNRLVFSVFSRGK